MPDTPVPPLQGQPSASASATPNQPQNGVDVQSLLKMLAQIYQAQQQKQPTAAPQGGSQPQSGSTIPMPGQPLSYSPPTEGGFGATRGILGLISNVENKKHARTALAAEQYMHQLNDLLTSGDPQAQEKASEWLQSDPKILKTLKSGLEYQPMTEQPPPEAIGVHTALNKIKAKNAKQQGQIPRRFILPQANQTQNVGSIIDLMSKLAGIQKSGAETNKANVESNIATEKLEQDKEYNDTQIKLLQAQTDDVKEKLSEAKDLAPENKKALEAQIEDYKSQVKLREAQAKYYASGRMTPQFSLSMFKAGADGLKSEFNDAKTDLATSQKDWNQFEALEKVRITGGLTQKVLNNFGYLSTEDYAKKRDAAKAARDAAQQRVNKISQALAKYQGQVNQVVSGQVPYGDAIINAYKDAGVSMDKMPDVPEPGSIITYDADGNPTVQ